MNDNNNYRPSYPQQPPQQPYQPPRYGNPAGAPPVGYAPVPPKKSSKAPIIIIGVIGLVLILTIVGLLVFKFVRRDPAPGETVVVSADFGLYDIEKAFADGTITFAEATEKVAEIRLDGKATDEDIKITTDYLDRMNTSKTAFEEGRTLQAAGSYAKAIEAFGKVVYTEDSNYSAAQKALQDSKNALKAEALTNASTLAAAGSYADAAEELRDVLDYIPDDADLTSKIAEYESKKNAGTQSEPGGSSGSSSGSSSGGSSGGSSSKQASSNPVIYSASTLVGEVLPESNVSATRSFGANKAIDGYYDSCWCVNTYSYGGVGAKIRFDLADYSTVSGVKIINGNLYHPYDDIYRSNGQIRTFRLTFSDGSSKTFTASYNSSASSAYEYFTFDAPVNTSSITLTVESAYAGVKYDTNVCLGEFSVY